MKNQASETTSRRRRDMRGIIPLARPGGESAFAFRPSAAEKSEQRSSLRYGLTAWLVVQNSGVPGLAGGMLCAWNHRTPRLRLGGLSIWVRLRAAESQTRRLALPCCMGRMPKPQAAWHGHPAREGDMPGTARRRSRDTGATIILRPGLGVPKFAFLQRAADESVN